MAIPITISPAGAGTVTQATVFTWNGPGDAPKYGSKDHTFTVGDRTVTVSLGDDGYSYDYNIAALTAIPAPGYRFVRFDVRTKYEFTWMYLPDPEVIYFDETRTENPACELPNSFFYLTDYSRQIVYNQDGSINGDNKFWTENVVAVFERVAPPHGHGLIYSPSRDKLIYDTTSGKLCYYP